MSILGSSSLGWGAVNFVFFLKILTYTSNTLPDVLGSSLYLL